MNERKHFQANLSLVVFDICTSQPNFVRHPARKEASRGYGGPSGANRIHVETNRSVRCTAVKRCQNLSLFNGWFAERRSEAQGLDQDARACQANHLFSKL